MNISQIEADYYEDGIIKGYEIFNGYLVLFIEVHFKDVIMFLEKSIFMGSNEYNELKTELKLGDINQYHDLDQLNGMGVHVFIIQLENGTHAIEDILFNEPFTEFLKTLENENEE